MIIKQHINSPAQKKRLMKLSLSNAFTTDEREWVTLAENVWFRPFCLKRSQRYWATLLRVRKTGILPRHRHPQTDHELVLKEKWHYVEQ